jgi:hypothetical protein
MPNSTVVLKFLLLTTAFLGTIPINFAFAAEDSQSSQTLEDTRSRSSLKTNAALFHLPVYTPSPSPSPLTIVDNSTHKQTPQESQQKSLESLSQSPDTNTETPSVYQLSDVQPTDWAYEALKSLTERYGCITGYPDGTFRGNKAMTRYEFAAGLNACLDKINEEIKTQTENFVTKEDLLALQKLQEEFATELASLRGRIDSLEARTANLENNQFSPTTKLYGFTVLTLTGLTTNGTIKAEGITPFIASRDATGNPIQRRVNTKSEITASHLVWLTLISSFTGKDALFMTLATGNGNPGINNFMSAGQTYKSGIPFGVQIATPVANELIVRELRYGFPVGDSLSVFVGPRINWFSFFDENVFAPYNFAGVTSVNALNSPLLGNTARGAGAVVEWFINKQFELHTGYLAENNEFLSGVRTGADPSKGFFGRPNVFSTELVYKPSAKANIRFLYSHNNFPDNGYGQLNVSAPIAGVLDDGYGGKLGGGSSHTFGINFDWLVNPHFGLFGRYFYASTQLQVKNGPDQTVNVQNFQAGLAFPDLGKQGALGTLSFVIPMDIVSGKKFFVSGAGNGATQYEIEANYFLPLTDHIAIAPSLYVIQNLNNFSNNPTVFVGSFRMQFSF